MTPLLLAAGLLTLAAIVAVLWPVLRQHRPDSRGSHEAAVYRDQLKEIERDLARGLIASGDAQAARREVERRLLKAATAATEPAPAAPRRGRLVVAAAAVLIPALTLGLYLDLGAPDLPDRPLAARQQELAQGEAPDVQAMVARLEARLRDQPGDVEGWLMLGRSRSALGDEPAAVEAYRKAQGLGPENPAMLIGLGQSLVGTAGGVVTPEARSLFERAQKAGVADPRAGFYLGLAAAQAGDGHRALDTWRQLLAGAPADAPWRQQVEEAVRTTARDLGIDPEAMLAQIPRPAAPPGPGQADMEAAARMSPEQQVEFIRGMVGRLEARLAADGSDVEGWQRLGQARLVLGEREQARAAYERGLALHPDSIALIKSLAGLLLERPQDEGGLPQVGERAAELYGRVAALAPDDLEAQWFLGIRAYQDGRKAEARERWQRVLSRLEPGNPDYPAVKQRLDALGS
jgi:cytochrome c-type biogenesis protein CcmH